MDPFNKEMLILFREKYVAKKNAAYHACMKEIMDEELPKISVEKIREAIQAHIRTVPWSTEGRAEIKLNLSKLNKPIVNEASGQKEHLEFWGVENSRKMFTYTFKGSGFDTFLQWRTYALTKDPQIAKVRQLLKEAFPEADIRPDIWTDITMYLHIDIVYYLPDVIQGCEETGILKKDKYGYNVW